METTVSNPNIHKIDKKPTPSEDFISDQARANFSGKGVVVARSLTRMPEQEKSCDEKPIKERKTNRCWAILAAIGTGIAATLFIAPITAALGAFTLGTTGALLGGLAGPEGMFIGSALGMTVGALASGAIPVAYLTAKVYNHVLEATNDDDVKRSKVADEIVDRCEGTAARLKRKGPGKESQEPDHKNQDF